MNPSKRRKARRYAVQGLYQWQLTGDSPAAIYERILVDVNLNKTDILYLEELITQIPVHQEKIDKTLYCITTRFTPFRWIHDYTQASRWFNKLTISSADIAASSPLFPALVPARSMACSMLSVVKTPNEIGIPFCIDICPKPLAHSPAT